MSEIKEFSPTVGERLGYYVYLLIDPETDQIFYIGKGIENRIFAHLNQAISSPQKSDKLSKIRSIQSKGLQVKHIIHRHGLTEKEAFEVEASLIDFIGLEDITNIVGGHHSDYRGRMSINEVVVQYDAPKIEIVESSILITVNRLFRRDMNADELYEITRGNWVVGERRNKAKFAFSVYKGNVRQVYEIQKWFPVTARSKNAKTQDRWRFNGVVAQDLQHYVGGSVEKYIGAQNPIKYVNC
ncbi:MAG: hypothetical protein IT247_00605 [Bacteroidia bacterium]|nr:hypothetical protein [Bacteroidia bacterium]